MTPKPWHKAMDLLDLVRVTQYQHHQNNITHHMILSTRPHLSIVTGARTINTHSNIMLLHFATLQPIERVWRSGTLSFTTRSTYSAFYPVIFISSGYYNTLQNQKGGKNVGSLLNYYWLKAGIEKWDLWQYCWHIHLGSSAFSLEARLLPFALIAWPLLKLSCLALTNERRALGHVTPTDQSQLTWVCSAAACRPWRRGRAWPPPSPPATCCSTRPSHHTKIFSRRSKNIWN